MVTVGNAMFNDSERLTPDPADDATPYPDVQAWVPQRQAPRQPGGFHRTRPVRNTAIAQWARASTAAVVNGTHQALAVSQEFPDIRCDIPDRRPPQVSAAVAFRGTETTNLVSQSAFLKPPLAAQVVTECTMSPRVHISGPDMQKPDFFSTRTKTGTTPVPGLSATGFSNTSGLVRSTHSGFQNSTLPSLTAERLDGYGTRWLQALSVTVRPLITAKRHPHIVNKFAILWGDDDAVNAYFDELLISSRPGRRGFAMEVLDELVELQRAVQEQHRF